jgi:hypothetical protein
VHDHIAIHLVADSAAVTASGHAHDVLLQVKGGCDLPRHPPEFNERIVTDRWSRLQEDT